MFVSYGYLVLYSGDILNYLKDRVQDFGVKVIQSYCEEEEKGDDIGRKIVFCVMLFCVLA